MLKVLLLPLITVYSPLLLQASLCLLLLQGLMLCKPQAYSLSHLDVSFRTKLHACNLALVKSLGPKGRHANIKAPIHQVVVHAAWKKSGLVQQRA
jgi:hypothetical protein